MLLKRSFICIWFLAGICLCSFSFAAEKKAPVVEPETNGVLKRLDKLERLVESQGLLDMLEQLNAVQNEINKLRGQIEVQNHSLEQLKQRQRDIYADVDRRIQRIESNDPSAPATVETTPPLEVMPLVETQVPANGGETSPVLSIEQIEVPVATPTPADEEQPAVAATENFTPTKMPPGNTTPDKATPSKTVDPAQAQASYQQAFKLLKQSQYDQAIEKFGQFLEQYPDSQFSDNAQYWRGEAYYITNRYEEAITEYGKLISQYPDSQKLTHSLLKMGYSYQELGQIDEAKKILTDLKEYYPGTTPARLADERLRQLNSTP